MPDSNEQYSHSGAPALPVWKIHGNTISVRYIMFVVEGVKWGNNNCNKGSKLRVTTEVAGETILRNSVNLERLNCTRRAFVDFYGVEVADILTKKHKRHVQ